MPMPTPKSIYNYSQVEDYRKRLGQKLFENGLNCEDIMNDAVAANFIKKYVEDEIITKRSQHDLVGIAVKLANVEIHKNGDNSGKGYPVINYYQGHDLIRTVYFGKNACGEVTTFDVFMTVNNKPKILVP